MNLVLLFILSGVAAVGCGLMAGLFFAFSHFIMQALGSRPAAEGMAAMQAINVKILTPWFLLLFLGTSALCATILILVIMTSPGSGGPWLVRGSVCYLVGSLVITTAYNVPLNNRLAAADPNSRTGQEFWQYYLRVWTMWNHLRTLSTAAGLVAFIVGMCKMGFPD